MGVVGLPVLAHAIVLVANVDLFIQMIWKELVDGLNKRSKIISCHGHYLHVELGRVRLDPEQFHHPTSVLPQLNFGLLRGTR